MEILVQWLDDLDDMVSAVGLLREKFRNLLRGALALTLFFAVQLAGILLALEHPPLALAAALLMFVTLLYRQVTAPVGAHGETQLASS